MGKVEQKTEELQTEKRNHFTFFRSFQEAIDQCQEKDQLALYRSIVNYALDGKEPSFDNPLLKLAWTLIKPNLHNGWVRSSNGRKAGGVSKPNMIGNKNASKTKLNQSQNEAKTKLNQSNRIGKDRNGMDRNNKETETKKDTLSLFSTPSPSSEYQRFLEWLDKNCPHILTMAIPTEAEYKKLLAKVGSKSELTNLLSAMDNRKDTAKKNNSIYRTALNWWNRDHKTE